MNTNKSFQDIPLNNKTGLSRLERSAIYNESQNQLEPNQIAKSTKQPQHIKIGDIILLTLSINVFQSDIEANEAR